MNGALRIKTLRGAICDATSLFWKRIQPIQTKKRIMTYQGHFPADAQDHPFRKPTITFIPKQNLGSGESSPPPESKSEPKPEDK